MPWFDFVRHYKIGIWQENDEIVALCSYESKLGEAFIFTAKGYEFLKPELLEYAEKNLYFIKDDGKKILQVRRKGLGKALLYEAINRTAQMGATYLIGGSREFYKAIGFETYYTIQYYKKVWE